jgi:hypothetical protein
VDVCFHELKYYVKVQIVYRFVNGQDFDDMRMGLQLAQKSNFAVGSLCIGGIAEGAEDLFEGNDPMICAIEAFPNDAVCTLPDFLQDLVALLNGFIDLFDVSFLSRHSRTLLTYWHEKVASLPFRI